MRYSYMDSIQARNFLELRRHGEEPVLDGYVGIKGSGQRYPLEKIKLLRTELLSIMKKYPSELKQRDEKGGRFEAEACELVHKYLPYDSQAFADSTFWIWLATIEFSDIVEWRHGGHDRFAALSNYGINNRVENLIFRMWLRADIAYDHEAKDPYWLAKRGDQDLWRSHILRQSYASVRNLAQVFIEFQCGGKKNKLTTEDIRELAKRIRRLRANIMFEYLNKTQLREMISQQASGLKMGSTSRWH